MFETVRVLAFLLLLVTGASAWASVSVGNGGSISLGGGALALGGGDLTVDGAFDVAGGEVSEAGNIVINGTLNGGTGFVSLLGNWINNGTFDAGLGEVVFVDSVGGSAQLLGNSTFFGLSLLSSAGGSFVLQSGTIQRVVGNLVIQGVSGAPVQIESSDPLQIAQILLEEGGSQDISLVGVTNVHATGQPLAPTETNQGGSGSDSGWFGSPLNLVPVPALSIPGLVLLILTMLGAAHLRRGSTL